MALEGMKTKIVLLFWLACQWSTSINIVQGHPQAPCTPIMEGEMCIRDNMEKCCDAKCTFSHAGDARASYDITIISYPYYGSSTCSEHLPSMLKSGYSAAKIRANNFDTTGNILPVTGTCHLKQCDNLAQPNGEYVVINKDYVGTVLATTVSQSLSASLSTSTLGTELPVESTPSIQPTSRDLPASYPSPTNSPSDEQSMHPATISDNENSKPASSQMPPSLFTGSDNEQSYIIVASVLSAVLLCILFGVLTVTCFILIFMRGKRMSDKSRVMASNINNYEEIPQVIQHTPTDSQNSETLEVAKVTHTYNVLEDPSARGYHWDNPTSPTYETIPPTRTRSDIGHVFRREPIYNHPGEEPVYNHLPTITSACSKPQLKEPIYSDPDANHLTNSNCEKKEQPEHSNPELEEPLYSDPQLPKSTCSKPQTKEPAYDDPDANISTCRISKEKEPASNSPHGNPPTASNSEVQQPTYSTQVKEHVYSDPQVKKPVPTSPQMTEFPELPEYRTVIRQGLKKVTATISPQHSGQQSLSYSPTEESSSTIAATTKLGNTSENDGKNVTLHNEISSDNTEPNLNITSTKGTPHHQEYSTVIRQKGKKVTATIVPQQLQDSELPFTEIVKDESPIVSIVDSTSDQDQQLYSMVVRKNGEKVSVRVQPQSDAN